MGLLGYGALELDRRNRIRTIPRGHWMLKFRREDRTAHNSLYSFRKSPGQIGAFFPDLANQEPGETSVAEPAPPASPRPEPHSLDDVTRAIRDLDERGWERLRDAAYHSHRRYYLNDPAFDSEDLLQETFYRCGCSSTSALGSHASKCVSAAVCPRKSSARPSAGSGAAPRASGRDGKLVKPGSSADTRRPA